MHTIFFRIVIGCCVVFSLSPMDNESSHNDAERLIQFIYRSIPLKHTIDNERKESMRYYKASTCDGKRSLVYDTKHRTIKLLGKQIYKLVGHTQSIITTIISDNGKKIASASQDGTIKVWDNRGNCRQTLTLSDIPDRQYVDLAFDKSGKLLVISAQEDAYWWEIFLWDLKNDVYFNLFNKNNFCRIDFNESNKLLVQSGEHAIEVLDMAPLLAVSKFINPIQPEQAQLLKAIYNTMRHEKIKRLCLNEQQTHIFKNFPTALKNAFADYILLHTTPK